MGILWGLIPFLWSPSFCSLHSVLLFLFPVPSTSSGWFVPHTGCLCYLDTCLRLATPDLERQIELKNGYFINFINRRHMRSFSLNSCIPQVIIFHPNTCTFSHMFLLRLKHLVFRKINHWVLWSLTRVQSATNVWTITGNSLGLGTDFQKVWAEINPSCIVFCTWHSLEQ